jgi:glucosamine--fructose-6-phosphate aminotransferase (isomerizing)
MHYLDDILAQPQTLRAVAQTYKEASEWQVLAQAWSQRSHGLIVLTGLGASFNALYPARYYLHQHSIAALHLDTGELIHYLPTLLQQPLLLVVVSQSGESIEIKRLLDQCQQQLPAARPWLVSITNLPGNALAQASNLALHTHAGAEVGVATKTYTSTIALLHWFVRALTGELQREDYLDVLQAAQCCEQFLRNWEEQIEPALAIAQSAQSFALVARGPAVTSAYNGALVIQEAARRPAAGFVGSQFRHGPMEMLSPDLATLIFTLPGRTAALSQRMAQDVSERGGHLITLGEAVPGVKGAHIALPLLDEWLSPLVDIVAVQVLVAKLAAATGIVPGEFRWAGKVIQQE